MRRECVGQSEGRCQLRTEQARSEYPYWYMQPRARHRAHRMPFRRREVIHQFDDILRKLAGIGGEIAPQRTRGELVRARRAPEPEVDAPGVERFKGAELFGNHERRMIGQHDPAGADAYGGRAAGDMPDQHGSRGAGDARHAVMLGQPVAPVAPALRVPGKIQRVTERLRSVAAFVDRGQVKDGEGDHV